MLYALVFHQLWFTTTYSGVPPSSPNHHAEWPVLRSISYSLLREHGIPSSYTHLIGCDRHGHLIVLQSIVCLLATHVQAVGRHPLQWGAATSGSSATHVQAVGGPSTPMGGSYLRIKQHPSDYFLRSKNPGGIILRSETPGGRLTPGGLSVYVS